MIQILLDSFRSELQPREVIQHMLHLKGSLYILFYGTIEKKLFFQ